MKNVHLLRKISEIICMDIDKRSFLIYTGVIYRKRGQILKKQYDILPPDARIPIRFTLCRTDVVARRRHPELELVLVLKGPVELIVDDRAELLREDDIFVINPNSLHSLRSDGEHTTAVLKIDLQKLDGLPPDVAFSCDSARDNDKGRYYPLKRLMAQLIKGNADRAEENFLFSRAVTYSIVFELCKRFRAEESASESHSQKYLERLNDIVRYIDEHYREGLTLNTLAETQHLSAPYLSTFFEKYMGVNFMTYYNELRLERATNELLVSDNSVETIALSNGFPNPRAFVTLFKKKYGTLPSLYRKRAPLSEAPSVHPDEGAASELSILAKYLPSPERAGTDYAAGNDYAADLSYNKIVSKEHIDVNDAKRTLLHTFKVFTAVGRAKELLLADVQKMLSELQREIGYEYIKFHGLLSDDMLVYTEDESGNAHYSFVYIDKAIDFLRSIGLKPLVQLSFMPAALASLPEKNVYTSPFNISPPKDMDKWLGLVTALTRHLIERYGLKEVKSWPFCVWNEPDTSDNLFGFKNVEDFYRLHKCTYAALKSLNKSLRVGSPSLLVTYNLSLDWFKNFIVWCRENDCLPDFLNIHYYDNDFSEDSMEEHRPAHPAHSRLNSDENSFAKCLGRIKLLFEELGIGGLPVYLTEWNLTVSHRNLLNDTCFKSCYLIKNLLENYDALDSFGYWVLTDMIEETQPSHEEFHGGLGLFTRDAIKKPHYYAFSFVNKLGNKLIERGEGYFIARSQGSIQIIMYNYEHFNHLFASGETFDMTFTERYTPFSQLGRMDVSLGLVGLPAGEYLVREQYINQQSGSAFDEWVRMGAPALTDEDIAYLKCASVPKLFVRKETVSDGALTVAATLEPLEVRLVEIIFPNR